MEEYEIVKDGVVIARVEKGELLDPLTGLPMTDEEIDKLIAMGYLKKVGQLKRVV